MKLKCKAGGLVGTPIVGADANNPCRVWTGDILECTKADAKVLLSLPGGYFVVSGKEETEPVEPISEPEDESDDEGYTRDELMDMEVPELLEFLDEADRETASELEKGDLVDLILGDAD